MNNIDAVLTIRNYLFESNNPPILTVECVRYLYHIAQLKQIKKNEYSKSTNRNRGSKWSCYLLVLFFFGYQTAANCQKLDLSQMGYPLYQKKTNLNRGLVVYKNDSLSFAYLVPREYYDLGKKKDTLILDLKRNAKSTTNYDVSCRNCKDMLFEQKNRNDSLYYVFRVGQEQVSFLVSYEQIPYAMMTSAINPGLTQDTAIGFIRLKNMFIHYTPFKTNGSTINVGVVDKNFNGIMDDSDLLSLSVDAYFQTIESGKSGSLGTVDRIRIDDKSYKIEVLDRQKFILGITPLNKTKGADIGIYSSILDARIQGKRVSDYLKEKPYLVLFYWGSRYNDYKTDFSALKKMGDNTEIVGIYDSKQLPNYLIAYSVAENLNILPFNEELKGAFDLSGYPTFILIDKTGILVSDVNDPKKVLELIK